MQEQLPPPLKGKKASEAFMEYVEPFLNALVLDRAKQGIYEGFGIEELEKILRVPWCIWNAIVAEGVPGNKVDFLAWMDSLLGHIPDNVKGLLDFMKKRKRAYFKQYQYYLGEYKIYYALNSELRIRIESRSPDTASP